VQPSRRPSDGRYGENPNRLQHYYQYQVIMKPIPADPQALLLESYRDLGLDPMKHDFRFVEDDWESPTLGAWGLGWEVWCDGMEVGQFTYFQQVGRHPLRGAELRDDLRAWSGSRCSSRTSTTSTSSTSTAAASSYRDVFHRAEVEYSHHNFRAADTALLFRHFADAERECEALLSYDPPLALPAYDQCIKASHRFNLLDARGAISVAERQAYIGRVRALAKRCCEAWVAGER
jgi:glycyl-tRNA synthetase alpha chain